VKSLRARFANWIETRFVPWILTKARESDCTYDEFKKLKKEADELIKSSKK